MNENLISLNPSQNFSKNGSVERTSKEAIQSQVASSQAALLGWRNTKVADRVELLINLLKEFSNRRSEIVHHISLETGKPISQARAEFDFFNSVNTWTLENTVSILAPKTTYETADQIHQLIREPYGVVATILPWNSPYGLFSWKLFPSLAAGNTLVVKHSEICPLLAELLEGIVQGSRLPRNVVNFVHGDELEGKYLLEQDIDFVSFTGSSSTGKEIIQTISRKLIPSIMELGGSNPGIVFHDADLNAVADRVSSGRFANCGQNCDAIKRLIVQEEVFDKLLTKLIDRLSEKTIGDPFDDETYFGTLASQDQLQTATSQLQAAIANNAKVEYQMKLSSILKGAYFPPTILTNVKRNMRVWQEEVFAPILPIVRFSTTEQAIKLANDSRYGLGATIFTSDDKVFDKVSQELLAGNIEQNSVSQWQSCIPFGGYKDSGIGRENGIEGLQNYTQIKVISKET